MFTLRKGDKIIGVLSSNVDDILHGEMEEGRVIRRKPRVYQTTPEEVEDHNRTHIPTRVWCRCCRMAKCKNDPRRKGNGAGNNREVPVIAMDYIGKKRKRKSEEDEE